MTDAARVDLASVRTTLTGMLGSCAPMQSFREVILIALNVVDEAEALATEVARLTPVVDAAQAFVVAEQAWIASGMSRGSARLADEEATNLRSAVAALAGQGGAGEAG